jgi:hypothetical protein
MAESYLEWAKENKAREGRDDPCLYKNHLKVPLANKRLNEITSFDLERLKSNLTKKELSPASVKHCLVLVREIYNKAGEWGKYRIPILLLFHRFHNYLYVNGFKGSLLLLLVRFTSLLISQFSPKQFSNL